MQKALPPLLHSLHIRNCLPCTQILRWFGIAGVEFDVARATDAGSRLALRFITMDCLVKTTMGMMVMVDLTEMATMDVGENDVEMLKTRGR